MLWSAHGALANWYRDAGGPLELWRAWGEDVEGSALDAGHFFPEEAPESTADALGRFLDRRPAYAHSTRVEHRQ